MKKPASPRAWAVWIPVAVILPALVSLYFIFFADGVFANRHLDSATIEYIFACAIFSACLAAGFGEELLFRGFVMRILEVHFGKIAAVLVPSIIFVLMHLTNMQNPNLLDILLLFVAGTSVSITFSLICYQSGSIFPGAVVHGIWNLIIIGQILTIGVNPRNANIFTYTLQTKSVLLTGGAFGIEASFPEVIGYAAVIILALLLINGKYKIKGR
ncbi:MAG: CPBP family intramembrane metalloprotease [Clostridiales bacterium]|nr:CPBP family intramembrane metalloprotease [Clostridiales bacterium]